MAGPAPAAPAVPDLEEALARVAAGAAARDAAPPAFPEDAIGLLERAGALAATVATAGAGLPDHAAEWDLARRVARADGSVGRIVDGHLNGVERVGVLAPPDLAAAEMDAVRAGRRRIGVWGADPAPGEGDPARLTGDGRIDGVKVFCSGAGGVDRALVVARDDRGDARLAYVDLTEDVEVDRGWYRASGLRSSESHRVVFHRARVVAVLGGPGEIVRDPWFPRDAIRTAASWAGIADRAHDAALDALAARGEPDDLAGLAAGRVAAARGTIDRWMDWAAAAARDPRRDLRAASVALRTAVADACRVILDEGVRAAGSRALAGGGDLDRCRRDLDLFLLQHRLEPMLARTGRALIEERRR
ncbi:hypothetical protein [Miltoncostaea oceani]|uniref:hypothetical protein n=1 Tax=Miltoncostaea oceani TaxID=2843216 RepID=UPI001C3CDB2E|nr:hypothetical protein [Miltoncostaea oceani]